MRYTLRRTAAPEVFPVTLAEAKQQCRIDYDDEDEAVEQFLAAAVDVVDGYEGAVGRALLTQSWELVIPGFHAHSCERPDLRPGEILLPLPPLQSVDGVSYLDASGTTVALDPSAWRVVDRVAQASSLLPATGTCWPATFCDPEAVTIGFTAGYGDAAAAVPPPIKSAIRLLVAHLYESRSAVVAPLGNDPKEIPLGVRSLLAPYCVTWF